MLIDLGDTALDIGCRTHAEECKSQRVDTEESEAENESETIIIDTDSEAEIERKNESENEMVDTATDKVDNESTNVDFHVYTVPL